MRSIVTVTTPATVERLTTVERVQAELGITGSETEIETAIDEASSRIEAELGYHLALETVIESFRPERRYETGPIVLERTPVVEIESITSDATALNSGEWVVHPLTGVLQWLTGGSGISTPWTFCTELSVAYSGGWVMPGEEDRTLPPAIESAAVAAVGSMWLARQRDPTIRAIEIPGVIRREYWTGGGRTSDASALPPAVVAMLAPFKRLR